ncbi:MAG: 50S ribosomal protein L23 [bacterium]
MERIYDIIKKPLLTEKSTSISEKQNSYVFEVATCADKQEIKEAIEKLFDVKVKDINTMISHGKMKRIGRHQGRRSKVKKAIVTLQDGQKIQLFEGV